MGKEKPPWMPWSPADFFSDPNVIAMTREERWRYREALDLSWLGATPGHGTEEHWMRLLGYTAKDWPSVRQVFCPCYVDNGETWTQKRLSDCYEHATEKSRKAKASIATRYERSTNVEQTNTDVPQRQRQRQSLETDQIKSSCPPDGGRLSILESPENPESKAKDSPRGKSKAMPELWRQSFDKFWEVYPRKEGKADAFKAWSKITPMDDKTLDAIRLGLKRYKALQQEPEFIKLPAGWIRSRRWEDEAPPPATLNARPVNNDPYSTRWNAKCPGCGEPRSLPLGVMPTLCETCKEARNGVQGR